MSAAAADFEAGQYSYRPLFTMTFQQYEQHVKETKARRDQVIARYKSMGYNVSCVEVPSYFETGERILRNYSLSSRYSAALGKHIADKDDQTQLLSRYSCKDFVFSFFKFKFCF